MIISSSKKTERRKMLSAEQTLRKEPLIKKEGLKTVAVITSNTVQMMQD